MSSSQDLFEKHISINPQTGQGKFSIPVASFYADEGLSVPLSLSLFCGLKFPRITLMPVGRLTGASGKNNFVDTADDEVLNIYELPIRDGRLITAKINESSEQDFGDFTIAVARVMHYDTGDLCDIEVRHEDGGKEKHIYSPSGGLLKEYFTPTGKSLKLEWETDIYEFTVSNPGSRLRSIRASDRDLLRTEAAPQDIRFTGKRDELRAAPAFKKLIVFPDTNEQVTYELEEKHDNILSVTNDSTVKVTVKGCGIQGKKTYKIKIVDDKFSSIDIITERTIVGEKEGETPALETSTHTESVTYADDKVSEYRISPGAGVDPLVEQYEYTADKTTITCRQMKKGDEKGVVLCTREYQYKNERQVSETVTANGVAVTQEQEVKVDDERAAATVISTKKLTGSRSTS